MQRCWIQILILPVFGRPRRGRKGKTMLDYLKKKTKEKGSLLKASKEIGISPNYLSNILNGNVSVMAETIGKIAHYCDLDCFMIIQKNGKTLRKRKILTDE